MINSFADDNGRLVTTATDKAGLQRAVWIDLLNPTQEEESQVEQVLGIDVPTLEEMEEIEASSRLYLEDHAAFMTTTLPAKTDTDEPQLAPITFVLADSRLITVRYHEPRAFHALPQRASRIAMGCHSGAAVLAALLELFVDRMADVLERASRDIAALSREVFQGRDAKPGRSAGFQGILEAIGRKGDLTSNMRECLVSLERMLGFLGQVFPQGKQDKDLRMRLKTLVRDCRSLTDHAGFMTQKITFLLDAVLGMINIEQNAIIKIFSVAAVVFLPPTLIASIYGMNFEFMPELDWPFGYPIAVGLMLMSAVLPYWFFKRRRWL